MYQESEKDILFLLPSTCQGQNMQFPDPKSSFLDFSLGSYGQISKL